MSSEEKMRVIIPVMLFIMSSNVFSKNIELKLKMTLKKGVKTQTSETKIITRPGEDLKISFSKNKFFRFNVKTTESFKLPVSLKPHNVKINKADIMISATVFVIENGKERLVGEPQLFSKYNEKTVFEKSDGNGEIFKLQVTPLLRI